MFLFTIRCQRVFLVLWVKTIITLCIDLLLKPFNQQAKSRNFLKASLDISTYIITYSFFERHAQQSHNQSACPSWNTAKLAVWFLLDWLLLNLNSLYKHIIPTVHDITTLYLYIFYFLEERILYWGWCILTRVFLGVPFTASWRQWKFPVGPSSLCSSRSDKTSMWPEDRS